MEEKEIITTKIFKSNKEFIEKRAQLIKEAIAFKSGTIKHPKKHLIYSLPNGKEAYFYKPGKETQRKEPNIHDMFPNIGINGVSDTEGWTFEKIWEYLIKISIIQQAAFKKVLVLLYRLCFFMDHKKKGRGKFRYEPSSEILDYINNLENFVLKDGFNEKFKSKEIGLLEFLYFVDLLGWNEDVKYHITNNKADFKTRTTKVGRVNTILSIINIVLLLNDYIRKPYERGDIKLLVKTFLEPRLKRDFTEISNNTLIKKLKPYINDK